MPELREVSVITDISGTIAESGKNILSQLDL